MTGAAVVVRGQDAVPIQTGNALWAALCAAAIACSQAAKLLYPEIVRARVEEIVRFDAGALSKALAPTGGIELRRPVLAGVGAIGCALVYALICVGAGGAILLLDPDKVSDSNLMRYVLFDERHLGQVKSTRPSASFSRRLDLSWNATTRCCPIFWTLTRANESDSNF